MAKSRSSFVCSNCGTVLVKWEGRCPNCKEWNTLVEQVGVSNARSKGLGSVSSKRQPQLLKEVALSEEARIELGFDTELNRVLGGGIVPGSLILIGGQPGIGKSTLILQLACTLDKKVLYVSGEESTTQIKMRASRLEAESTSCLIYCETGLEDILDQVRQVQPDLLLIDSIQTIHTSNAESSVGSVTQIRECTAALQHYAKESNTPVIIIGHITKEGSLAGPKVLEHMVDVVLQFEGDRNYVYRILRTIKNRFGSTDEIGIYEMERKGLRPVSNPSELLISPTDESLSGMSIASTIEGVRPLLIETQALVSTSVYGHPQRSATGFDNRRLSMLLAVLEKKCHLYYSQNDVFLNIAGGIKVTDPAIDLAIVVSLISALQDIPVDRKFCFAAEVGLSGEVRAVNRIEQRILEAERNGFESIVISKFHQKGLPRTSSIQIHSIGKVTELVELLFS